MTSTSTNTDPHAILRSRVEIKVEVERLLFVRRGLLLGDDVFAGGEIITGGIPSILYHRQHALPIAPTLVLPLAVDRAVVEQVTASAWREVETLPDVGGVTVARMPIKIRIWLINFDIHLSLLRAGLGSAA